MKRKNKLKLMIVVVLVVLGIVLVGGNRNIQDLKQDNLGVKQDFQDVGLIPLVELDRQLLDLSIREHRQGETEKTKGGIVPHHMLASDLMAEFYSKLDPKTETVILVGPNHDELGASDILTTASNFESLDGIVKNNQKITLNLAQKNLAQINDQVFLKEHSILIHIPYIKHYLPQAKIVPLIFKQKTPLLKIENLKEKLTPYLEQENTLLIASVDFSHYLAPKISNQKDQESIAAIQQKNYRQIQTFHHDHLDSPASIILILKTLEEIGYPQPKILQNTDSATLLQDPQAENTSYFTVLFVEE
jgi:hypothetical protein